MENVNMLYDARHKCVTRVFFFDSFCALKLVNVPVFITISEQIVDGCEKILYCI